MLGGGGGGEGRGEVGGVGHIVLNLGESVGENTY